MSTDPLGVDQTILANTQQGVYGNCLQAAVATALDLPINAVPHFSQFVWWPAAMELWARGRNLTVKTLETDEWPQEGVVIVGGISPRGIPHTIVVRDGGEWDPHPSRAGLTKITDWLWFEEWPHNGPLPCWVCGSRRFLGASDLGGEADAVDPLRDAARDVLEGDAVSEHFACQQLAHLQGFLASKSEGAHDERETVVDVAIRLLSEAEHNTLMLRDLVAAFDYAQPPISSIVISGWQRLDDAIQRARVALGVSQ